MQPEKQSQYTFIIHLWRENTDEESFVWRGSVDDVRSGERLYFQSIERLKEVIKQMMNKAFAGNPNGNEREGANPFL